MKIYIIRHGETDTNANSLMQGCLDEPLNENGRKLATVTGQAMHHIHFDHCISSPLKRAKETVEIILRETGNQIPILIDRRISEINFGDFEGQPISAFGNDEKNFFFDPFHFKGFSHGECIQDVCNRTQEFLNELILRNDGKTYLISTHGCALRAMLNYLYNDPSDFWHGHVPYNCTVSIVSVDNKQAKLLADDLIYYDPHFIVDRYQQ